MKNETSETQCNFCRKYWDQTKSLKSWVTTLGGNDFYVTVIFCTKRCATKWISGKLHPLEGEGR